MCTNMIPYQYIFVVVASINKCNVWTHASIRYRSNVNGFQSLFNDNSDSVKSNNCSASVPLIKKTLETAVWSSSCSRQPVWEGFRVRLDQKTALFVCFDLGGVTLLRDTSRTHTHTHASPHYHSVIPPQEPPLGHSQLEPLWPPCHPLLTHVSQGILRAGKVNEGRLCCVLVSTGPNHNQTGSFWGVGIATQPGTPIPALIGLVRGSSWCWPLFYLPVCPRCSPSKEWHRAATALSSCFVTDTITIWKSCWKTLVSKLAWFYLWRHMKLVMQDCGIFLNWSFGLQTYN